MCACTGSPIQLYLFFCAHDIEFPHSNNAICNEDSLPCPSREAGPPKSHLGTAMLPTNMKEDDGPTLTLKDVLCMASSLIACCVFFNKNQLELNPDGCRCIIHLLRRHRFLPTVAVAFSRQRQVVEQGLTLY